MAMIRRPRDGALLVSEEANPSGELFHRPLGGHVEFGEHATDTVHREFGEEIGEAPRNAGGHAHRKLFGQIIVRHMCATGEPSNPSPSSGWRKFRPTTSSNSS
jgi:8-oxo-dGTP pyrophosphatase MutT (NUDIX family)